MKKPPIVTLTVAIAACFVWGASGREALAFEAGAGELWQLATCHLVHFSTTHLVWDLCGFVLLGSLSERLHRTGYACFLVVAALAVPPLACAMTPSITHYGGLSGLVIGQVAFLLALALVRRACERRVRRSVVLGVALLALLAKQLYEMHLGDTSIVTMSYEGFSTVPAAHLVSVLVGAAVPLSLWSAQRLVRAARLQPIRPSVSGGRGV